MLYHHASTLYQKCIVLSPSVVLCQLLDDIHGKATPLALLAILL